MDAQVTGAVRNGRAASIRNFPPCWSGIRPMPRPFSPSTGAATSPARILPAGPTPKTYSRLFLRRTVRSAMAEAAGAAGGGGYQRHSWTPILPCTVPRWRIRQWFDSIRALCPSLGSALRVKGVQGRSGGMEGACRRCEYSAPPGGDRPTQHPRSLLHHAPAGYGEGATARLQARRAESRLQTPTGA